MKSIVFGVSFHTLSHWYTYQNPSLSQPESLPTLYSTTCILPLYPTFVSYPWNLAQSLLQSSTLQWTWDVFNSNFDLFGARLVFNFALYQRHHFILLSFYVNNAILWHCALYSLCLNFKLCLQSYLTLILMFFPCRFVESKFVLRALYVHISNHFFVPN